MSGITAFGGLVNPEGAQGAEYRRHMAMGQRGPKDRFAPCGQVAAAKHDPEGFRA